MKYLIFSSMKNGFNISPLKFLLPFFAFTYCSSTAQHNTGSYLDTKLSFEKRAVLLMQQLTTDEKIAFLQYTQPAIERLRIPAYNWWNEALHGVARNGVATVFPQAIAMAATWDIALIKQMGDAVSTEARAKYNEALAKNGANANYEGLTFWSPNINIFRDPRWGRGQETYGEDPFLTAQIGTAYVSGLQGDDAAYLKVAATAKHFAVHSGPEATRHSFNVTVSDKDLYETYLPAFEALVKNAKVEGVMCAYNRFEGAPCCASGRLLKDILRSKWKFNGHIVTDCWAISDMVGFHKTYANEEEAAVASLLAGSDLSCGPEMGELKKAVQQDPSLVKNIDSALFHLLLTRFKLGMFDPPQQVPWSVLSLKDNNTSHNRALAKQVALESMVLLKNADNVLPLKKDQATIAVIGPYADDVDVLLGNYNGTPTAPVTFLNGIKTKLGTGVKILYAPGTKSPDTKYADEKEKNNYLDSAIAVAGRSDLVIVVAGISSNLEGEELKIKIDGFDKGDRTSLDLPADQEELLKALYATGKKIVLVLTGGSALSINWEKENIPAIIDAWYPGEEGGTALADILFGDHDPSGRLPVTFYKSVTDLPAFDNYDMKGRTYRYFNKEPLYPFGYGLSYSSFKYDSIFVDKKQVSKNATITVSVKLSNTGEYDGDEVVQLYVKKAGENTALYPIKALQGFKKVFLKKNESKTISFSLGVDQLRYYDEMAKTYKVAAGEYKLLAGSSSEDIRLKVKISVQ